MSSFSLPGTGLGISMWPSAGQWYEWEGKYAGGKGGTSILEKFPPFFQETHRRQPLFFCSLSRLDVTVRRGSLKNKSTTKYYGRERQKKTATKLTNPGAALLLSYYRRVNFPFSTWEHPNWY